jgi:hypothetical protein
LSFIRARLDIGQLWDAPNGSVPLQWIAVEGLISYGQNRRDDWGPMYGQRLASLRQTGKLVENTISRRLRGLLSFDDRRARVIGWEMFERADALLHEALDRDECPSLDCGNVFL